MQFLIFLQALLTSFFSEKLFIRCSFAPILSSLRRHEEANKPELFQNQSSNSKVGECEHGF